MAAVLFAEKRVARIALTLALLLAVGCDPVSPPGDGGQVDGGPPSDVGPPGDGGALSLQVGVGEGVFHPIEDRQELEMVTGCQGSQHVWTAVRAQGIARRGTIIELSLTRERDETVISQPFRVRISLQEVAGQPYAELAGLTLLVPEPEDALGEDLTLRATVVAEDGAMVEDSRPVRVIWGEGGCG